ncbi:hypothetical protein FQR65_LT02540 [Abscondita terminalis]|nr:hypothetical protein FQR65_LT02540 [Abscondita terminalis]
MNTDLKPSSDSVLYKCKKAVFRNYKKSICKWSGTVHEYIQHVKRKHKENYFTLEKDTAKFQWKLPSLGDQLDVGIFKHKLGHFLYEIVYKKDEGNLFFALTCVENFGACDEYRYVLLFQKNRCRTMKLCKCSTNTDPTKTLKLIHEQKFYVLLDNNYIQSDVDSNRILEWKIGICNN